MSATAHADAIRHLEIPVRRRWRRQGSTRPARHASDRTGPDPDGRAGRRSDRLSLRHRRPRQHLGHVGEGASRGRSPSKTILRWRSASRSGRRTDDGLLSCLRRETPGSCSGSGSSDQMAANCTSWFPRAWASRGRRTATRSTTSRRASSAMKKIAVNGGEPVTVRPGTGAQHDRRRMEPRCTSWWSARSWTAGQSSRFVPHRSATARLASSRPSTRRASPPGRFRSIPRFHPMANGSPCR